MATRLRERLENWSIAARGVATGSIAAGSIVAFLVTDRKDRGLFEETLIVWMGECGRKPKTNHDSGAWDDDDKAWPTFSFHGVVSGDAASVRLCAGKVDWN